MYKSRLDLFSNYKSKPQNVDIYWTNIVASKVNRFLSANITLDLLYDDDAIGRLQIHQLLRVLNEKKKLVVLQAMMWLIFFSFNYVYFNKKSSVLAAIWTLSDAAFAAGSFLIARKEDKKLSNYYLPLLVWTLFAGSVAVYQALKNPDPVFKTKVLIV